MDIIYTMDRIKLDAIRKCFINIRYDPRQRRQKLAAIQPRLKKKN
jgi:hypothetical protein